MNLTILGLSLGQLPAWIPVWAIPLTLVHVALFAALIVPAWVGLARARAGGPLSLVLVLPVLGLLMLCPIYMNRVLPYAHWARFWGIFVLIPGINIFFLWIFAFAPWKRRYIPLDQEEYSEHTGLSARRDAPKLDGRTGSPVSQTLMATPDGAPAPGPMSGPPKGDNTMVPGGVFSPRSGEPAHTMMAGPAGAAPRTGTPSPRTGPPAEPPPIMLPGGHQTLDTPIAPMPPIPARSMQPPSAPPVPPPAPPAAPGASSEPPRPRATPRTQDLTFDHLAPPPPVEAATVRVAAPQRAGGRAWRLVGANDVAAAIDFTVQEAALLESESGLLIGRSARAHFVIDHDSISRNHARLLLDRGTLCLEDLDSMNGTWVDGAKLEANAPVPLQPNGIVEIGKIRLRVTGG